MSVQKRCSKKITWRFALTKPIQIEERLGEATGQLVLVEEKVDQTMQLGKLGNRPNKGIRCKIDSLCMKEREQ